MRRTRQYNPDPLWIARRKKRLEQSDIAHALSISTMTIIRAEQGSALVHPDMLQRICDFLDIPFDSLNYSEKNLEELSLTA